MFLLCEGRVESVLSVPAYCVAHFRFISTLRSPLYGLWVIMGYGLWGYGEAKISVNTCLSVLHLSYSGRFKHPL